MRVRVSCVTARKHQLNVPIAIARLVSAQLMGMGIQSHAMRNEMHPFGQRGWAETWIRVGGLCCRFQAVQMRTVEEHLQMGSELSS